MIHVMPLNCIQVFCPELRAFHVANVMLRVTLATSGNEVLVLDAEEFEEAIGCNGRSISALKRYLSARIGRSRFRQRILDSSNGELGDEHVISPPLDLQLVLLNFGPPHEREDAEFISACEQNLIDQVEAMLQPQNPDTRNNDGWPCTWQQRWEPRAAWFHSFALCKLQGTPRSRDVVVVCR